MKRSVRGCECIGKEDYAYYEMLRSEVKPWEPKKTTNCIDPSDVKLFENSANYVECHELCKDAARVITHAILAELCIARAGDVWKFNLHRRMGVDALSCVRKYHESAMPLISLQVSRSVKYQVRLLELGLCPRSFTGRKSHWPPNMPPVMAFRHSRAQAAARGVSSLATHSWPPPSPRAECLEQLLCLRSQRSERVPSDSGCESDESEIDEVGDLLTSQYDLLSTQKNFLSNLQSPSNRL